MNTFLSINFNISFECSKNPTSHRDGSFEYTVQKNHLTEMVLLSSYNIHFD